MMLVKPEKVVFETEDDIIRYVCRGLPPSKENFEKVINVVRKPFTDEQTLAAGSEDVVIRDTVLLGVDKELFAEVLEKVYKENVRNRNIALATVATVAVGTVLFLFTGGGKKE